MMHADILDPAPVPPPGLVKTALGKPVQFAELVRLSGMPDVISTNSPPLVTVHAGERDFKVPTPGRPVYCVGGATLPAAQRARAREIMRRLAYGYLDWAARETVARYHRDLKRAAAPAPGPGGLPATVKVRRLVRNNPGISVGEISRLSGIAQPNVSRAIAQMESNDEITVVREGRHARCYVTDQMADNSPTFAP